MFANDSFLFAQVIMGSDCSGLGFGSARAKRDGLQYILYLGKWMSVSLQCSFAQLVVILSADRMAGVFVEDHNLWLCLRRNVLSGKSDRGSDDHRAVLNT